MDLDFKFKFRVIAQISKISESRHLIPCYRHSSLILLFHCTNGADRTGPINTREPLERHARTSNSKYVRTRGANWSEYRSNFGGVRILRTSRTYFEMEVRMPLQSGPTVSL
jgi:hypothetical protein